MRSRASGRIYELEWFGFLVALVDAAPHAADLRRRVADFKGLVLPEMRGRVGIISYEQLGTILFAHGETNLAQWVTTRLADGLEPPHRPR